MFVSCCPELFNELNKLSLNIANFAVCNTPVITERLVKTYRYNSEQLCRGSCGKIRIIKHYELDIMILPYTL